VGEAKRKGEQDREIAKINAETAVQKTERDSERAQAEAQLATRKTVLERDVSIAGIEAKRATEVKDQELKREVELKRAAAEVERLRASDVVKATIARESKQQAADAKAYETQRNADAKAYEVEAEAKADFIRKKQEAEAAAYKTKQEADARNYAMIKDAEGSLQAELNQAQGMEAMANAYVKLGQAFGGPEGLLQWFKIKEGTYVDLAKAQAAGLQGLNPKISWWGGANQGGSGSGEGGSGGNVSQVDAVRNLYTMLPPLMTTIHEQTGITMPEWQYGRLPNAEGGGKKVNGTK
jgi:flotillin